jgi:hypothetical protein
MPQNAAAARLAVREQETFAGATVLSLKQSVQLPAVTP